MYKFRGKRVGDDVWIYGDLLHGIGEDCHIQNLKDGVGPNKYRGPQEVHPASVGQCTGLKDKDGVDVYKNDVLVINAIRWEVLWSQYSLGFVLSPYSENGIAFAAAEEVFCVDCENDNDTRQEIEIVGNTTDNPELLTK